MLQTFWAGMLSKLAVGNKEGHPLAEQIPPAGVHHLRVPLPPKASLSARSPASRATRLQTTPARWTSTTRVPTVEALATAVCGWKARRASTLRPGTHTSALSRQLARRHKSRTQPPSSRHHPSISPRAHRWAARPGPGTGTGRPRGAPARPGPRAPWWRPASRLSSPAAPSLGNTQAGAAPRQEGGRGGAAAARLRRWGEEWRTGAGGVEAPELGTRRDVAAWGGGAGPSRVGVQSSPCRPPVGPRRASALRLG